MDSDLRARPSNVQTTEHKLQFDNSGSPTQKTQ